MTPEQLLDLEYINTGLCPRCHRANFQDKQIDYQNEIVVVNVTCRCGASFDEVFTLTGITNIMHPANIHPAQTSDSEEDDLE